MSNAISIQDVTFRYEKEKVLDHLNCDIQENTITLIMGKSGCGKSTLAYVMASLYPENGGNLESGDIFLFGQSIKEMNPIQRVQNISLMFQNPNLQFCMDTLENELYFCLENMQVPKEEMDTRIQECVQQMKVEHLLHRDLHTLSGGEKQKAMLACMFILKSRCMILDESFANIDIEYAKEIIELLVKLKEKGHTILVIDHKADLWMDVVDEIIICSNGKILQRGIHSQNIEQYKELFLKEGLCYPFETKKQITHNPSNEIILSLENVNIEQNQSILLKNGNATFYKGQMSAIIGKSGCGKTTTFLSILKQHPFTGKIEFNHTSIKKMKKKDLYQNIGMVFQNPENQFLSQNVKEEIEKSLEIWHRTENADSLLKDYGFEKYISFSPYMLSQGQQRRLAVLSVLCTGQKVLLLDEPTYGQDDYSTTVMMKQLQNKIKEGLSVIFITHDISLAYTWANRIYKFENQTLKYVERESEL